MVNALDSLTCRTLCKTHRLLAVLQAKVYRDCRFLLFLHHIYQVSLNSCASVLNMCNYEEKSTLNTLTKQFPSNTHDNSLVMIKKLGSDNFHNYKRTPSLFCLKISNKLQILINMVVS